MSFILPLREVLELLLSLKTIILIEIVFILPGLGAGQGALRQVPRELPMDGQRRPPVPLKNPEQNRIATLDAP